MVSKYPVLDHFIADILHTAHLDNAEILFFAPHMHTMFVKPSGNVPPMRPSSVSCQMVEKFPYTMWVYEDDIEN